MNSDYKNKGFFRKIIKKVARYFDGFYQLIKVLFGLISLFLLVLISLAGGTGIGYFASLVEDTPILAQKELGRNINNYNQKSTIFYSNDSKISDLRTDLIRTPISLDSASPLFLNAVIATEDENFYEHKGIVPKAIIRAATQELTDAASISGGSTITQQLIKQQVLSNEVSHSRKAIEILYATDLESKFSKEDILQAYINVSPFGRNSSGHNIAGIEEAAQGIFGVPNKDLTLPQAAFLAGLPKSPISYSPYTQQGELKEDMEAGLSRQKDVLYSMFREGYITEKNYDQARNYDLKDDFLLDALENKSDPSHSYIYDLVEREARKIIMEKMMESDEVSSESFNDNPELKEEYTKKADSEIRNSGYKIYSTIDPDIHNAIEEKTKQTQDSFGATRTAHYKDENGESQIIEYPAQVGGTLIENSTGRVIAFVGGRDYEKSEFNIPFDSRRGSGSAIKPLITYGPALAENHITPATIIPDTELIVPDGSTGSHEITNFGNTTNTWKDARHWLAVSQNIPNTKLYMDMLKNNINPSKYIRALGIGPEAITDDEFYNASTSLGGYGGGPTATELAAAYAAIGNKGVYNSPYVIQKIEDKNNEVIYEHQSDPTTVWSEATNFLLYDMLRDVSKVGTAKSLNSYLNFDIDLASKTGTTSDFRDVWYAGVTPKVSYVSWMGYDAPANHNFNLTDYDGLSPSRRNIRNWANVLNTVYKVNPDLIGLSDKINPPADGSISTDSVLVETGMKPGTFPVSGGKEASISGTTKSEFFAKDNIPGTTSYDFAIGATTDELQKFWKGHPIRIKKEKKNNNAKKEKAEKKKTKKEKAKKEKNEN